MKPSTKKKSTRPAFLAIDFFSGAGGTTRGLIDAGGYVIAGVDNNAHCEETYTHNNRNKTLDEEKARFLNYDIFPKTRQHPNGQQSPLFKELGGLICDYKEKAGKNIPLLFAICAPCQPFTNLSKRTLTEKRKQARKRDSGLLSEACKFVAKFKPHAILSENVRGDTNGDFQRTWKKFQTKLTTLGYEVHSDVVCTSKFGIPQYRKRSILIAVRRDTEFDPITIPSEDPRAKIVTVKDAISHLPSLRAGETHEDTPNHKASGLQEINRKRLMAAKPGQSNIDLQHTKYGDLRLACHKRVNRKQDSVGFGNVYMRMHPDQPSPTITTKFHTISCGRFGHYDKKQVRAISLREAAALQSFRDDYVFCAEHSIKEIASMIGNAVPPKLSKFFAKYIIRQIQSI